MWINLAPLSLYELRVSLCKTLWWFLLPLQWLSQLLLLASVKYILVNQVAHSYYSLNGRSLLNIVNSSVLNDSGHILWSPL